MVVLNTPTTSTREGPGSFRSESFLNCRNREVFSQKGTLLLREGRDFEHLPDASRFFRLVISGEDAGQDELVPGIKVADSEFLGIESGERLGFSTLPELRERCGKSKGRRVRKIRCPLFDECRIDRAA